MCLYKVDHKPGVNGYLNFPALPHLTHLHLDFGLISYFTCERLIHLCLSSWLWL